MDIRIILNGKKAAFEPVREAIYRARENGRVDVRVTWEAGLLPKNDAPRFYLKARNSGDLFFRGCCYPSVERKGRRRAIILKYILFGLVFAIFQSRRCKSVSLILITQEVLK